MPNLIDIGIIAALREELDMIRQLIPGFEEVDLDGTKTWYKTTIESHNKKKYTVVAARQTKMGPMDAAALANDFFMHWQPAYLIVTGIAGALSDDVNLGDVIVSQQVIHYDLGKAAVDDDGKSVIRYRPEGYPCSMTLIRQTEAVADSERYVLKETALAGVEAVIELIKKQYGDEDELPGLLDQVARHQAAVHFGPLASGSLVVSDPAKKKQLLALHGKVL
ncbi:hypothetical protein ACFFGT_09810 [Mucilaginibacter angelicae]|uniref:Nucleoside phosphorylase domain-containing protein n=1 Tax=Mucilaginibacter angelicae TaxID=869718 RepID=A0ABV6L4X0_9SPHI